MLTRLEMLEQEAFDLGIHLDEKILRRDDPVDGLYIRPLEGVPIILINRHRSESIRTAVLAEELGHHFTACGDIISQQSVINRKQEKKGHYHAIRRLIPPEILHDMMKSGFTAIYEIAEELSLPEYFVKEAYAYYTLTG